MSEGRALLLGAIGEEEFARQVKRWAARYGWCGTHVRYSQGVVEGVHTFRLDGHSDAHGAFDWEFKHAEPGHPLLKVELKAAGGRLSRDQQRELAHLQGCTTVQAHVWKPDMEDEIRRVLEGR
jgi:hypothetical protein